MNQVIGVSGCICSDCRIYGIECDGCHAIEGKACWLDEVGLEICDFYECSVIDKNLNYCGECTEIPCSKFWENKNPKWTDEEHRRIVNERVILLKGLTQG